MRYINLRLLTYLLAYLLLECVRDWALSLHNRVPQDVIYFDFSHTFDCVVYSKLCIKLQIFGIDGLLLLWICAFLSNRTQRVVVEGFSSHWVIVISGVPQGSVLGPVLFLLYVDDVILAYSGSVRYKLFADDLKNCSNVDSSCASINLQTALRELERWCCMWQLQVNLSKTSVWCILVLTICATAIILITELLSVLNLFVILAL